MLLPDPESNKSVERQNRTREESKIVVDKYMRDQRSSVDHPVKKVYATTSIQRLTASKTTQDDGVIISNVDARVVNEQDKPEVSEVNRKLSSIQKIYQADSVIITKNKLVAHRSVDNSTQTEWCTMLLEARRDEDGRYSFYLPPLSVVKYYGL
ncbi:uncharacterized protein LOC114355674 [Ostrinia furnacalis]|uniref:uncharacterized protein LOC114355674 n=1 Tax=Ostrinia furnacalis TaxID=93504 RepID=UPI00103C7D8F|nr:uncharacterized protein LOC114355674 [Ostrinia furnacalis]